MPSLRAAVGDQQLSVVRADCWWACSLILRRLSTSFYAEWFLDPQRHFRAEGVFYLRYGAGDPGCQVRGERIKTVCLALLWLSC